MSIFNREKPQYCKDRTGVKRIFLEETSDGGCLVIAFHANKDYFNQLSFDIVKLNKGDWTLIKEPSWRPFKDGEEFFNLARNSWFRYKDRLCPFINVATIDENCVNYLDEDGDLRTFSYKDQLEYFEMFNEESKTWTPAGVLE